MNISEVKELMAQFDASSLKEFSFKTVDGELAFSKNDHQLVQAQAPLPPVSTPTFVATPVVATTQEEDPEAAQAISKEETPAVAEGEEVPSPLVGVAYLASSPDKPAFVSVGDSVKKGQTLLIIEAMKVMNEIPAPRDGIVTEILVTNEEVVEFGQGLVRIK
ncbi:acetyl-CoA carboxylase biotin carboxyl carrier protein [Streptococcus orisratti]|uniref:acetyl-CoA carboxylase biotin carboxyl carrier protein n=1 Tax=Streptococcus TaxID=1301 RepID=UPI000475E2A8|nr:acetyl-CoA carboxylase biotin carboxyl carrier protein [Streptococcus orisratti]